MVLFMSSIALTQELVRTLSADSGRTKLTIFDKGCKNLVFEVRNTGRKTYYFRYKDSRGITRQPKISDANSITLKQVRMLCDGYRTKLVLGEDPFQEKQTARSVPTFSQFIDEQYLPHIKTYKRSWGTDVSILKNHLLPRLGKRYMDDITRQDIVKLHLDRKASGAAAGSANRLLIMLRFIFNLALRWEVPGVKDNPTKNIPLMPENNKKERYLSQDEARQLYAAVCQSDNPMLQFIVPMLILTGARKREVLDARWDDFDLERRLWRIPTTKLGKPRHVPISDGVLSLLGSVPRSTEHVFANPKTGKPYVSIFCSWNTARKQARLPEVRVHDLRHSFASLLINNGRSLYEVQKILGHTQVKTTQRYAHLAPQTLLDASNVATLAVGSVMGVLPNRVVDVPLVAAG
jgi:integrase